MGLKRKLVKVMAGIARFIQYGDLPTWYYEKKGMKIGKNFCRQGSKKFDITNCWLISFGDNVTVANKVQLLAHDDTMVEELGYRKIGTIKIGNNVFLGASSTILLNTRIGDNAIIAAGSVVTRDIPENCVAAGVPAKVIGKTDEYILKNAKLLKEKHNFDINYSVYGKINDAKKKEMQEILKEDIGFVKIKKFSAEDN